MARIETLRNLGPETARWLRTVGVDAAEDLERLGAAEAWVRLRDAGHRPSRLALWAMHGALLGLDWRELPPEMKARLLEDVARLEDHRNRESRADGETGGTP